MAPISLWFTETTTLAQRDAVGWEPSTASIADIREYLVLRGLRSLWRSRGVSTQLSPYSKRSNQAGICNSRVLFWTKSGNGNLPSQKKKRRITAPPLKLFLETRNHSKILSGELSQRVRIILRTDFFEQRRTGPNCTAIWKIECTQTLSEVVWSYCALPAWRATHPQPMRMRPT